MIKSKIINNVNKVVNPVITTNKPLRKKGLRNGSITKNKKKYVRIFDLSRYSNGELVNALYSKKWNNDRTKYIIEINNLLDERIQNGKCTKYEIDNLKYLANIKKHKIVKSIINNNTTTTTTTTTPAVRNIAIYKNCTISFSFHLNTMSKPQFFYA